MMKITKNQIKRYEGDAKRFLAGTCGVDDQIIFDHFGVQTLSTEEYKSLKNYFIEKGKFEGEIFYHNRRLGKFLLGSEGKDKMELIEPHPGEVILQVDCYVEHVAFIVPDISRYFDIFQNKILSTFSIGDLKGFKIQGPTSVQIELMSNEF